MKIEDTPLEGVKILTPRQFSDDRGYFFEFYNATRYQEAGISGPFLQDNVSKSRQGVLRGLHFQYPHAQGKLVGVLAGEVFDVAVDIRRGSPQFGRWFGAILSAANLRQLWIPEGYAHGFLVLSDEAIFTYKCTSPYSPGCEHGISWKDPNIGINWPRAVSTLSPKDASAPLLSEMTDLLPPYDEEWRST